MAQQPPLKNPLLTRETILLFVVWVSLLAFVIFVSPFSDFISAWTFIIPCGWILYQVSLRFIYPRSVTKRFPLLYYTVAILLCCIALFFAIVAIVSAMVEDEDYIFGVAGIAFCALLFIVAPVQWFVFRRLSKTNEELFAVRRELGQTEANVDFLRSQINPHFLFNALNTLYGIAIQENAGRTSEAIEKLGSMMRFMLQENVQEKIPLARDVEYLNNFIAIQQLRTEGNPNLRTLIAIQREVDPTVQIAPMLLIPFIENAYKHGISLREESQIRISLELKESTLHLDVFNSKHVRPENDPEKHSNGIGLVNVRQRLQLVYPGRHELVIRETATDYFVHLVLTLA